MENNETMINEEQELNDVEVIDTDMACEGEEPEVSDGSLDGLSFAFGAIAALLVAKGIKKVVNSAPVQNKISDVKAKIAERKELKAAAKEAKKLKVVQAAVVEEDVEETVTDKVANGK